MGTEKRSKGFLQAAELIHNLLKKDKNPLSQQFLRWKLWNHWEQVVGPSIGKNTEPVAYHNSCLYVWVPSSVWLQEMRFMESALLEKINAYLGQRWAYKIKFTLDRKSVPTFEESSQEMRDFLSK